MSDNTSMDSLNWSQYELIDKALLASFWVKMSLDENLNSSVDFKKIKYYRHEKNHCPLDFWENTQFLIRGVCKERESLMGELFNKLNRKISLHFDCFKTSNDSIEIEEVDFKERDRLFVRVGFPYLFDDSVIYSGKRIENDALEVFVTHGYENAEVVLDQVNVSDVEKAINEAIEIIWQKVGFQINENEDSVKHLLRVAISFCYPSQKYPHKIFSAIVDGQYVLEKKDKELSCKGAFLLWKPTTNLLSFINKPDSGQGYNEHMEFLLLEKYIAKEGAKETTEQMVALVRKNSIKSAKAAIMSRNMSHNLGSHVMAYLKNDLRSVSSIFSSQVLLHLFPDKYNGDRSKIINSVELPFLVGLGGFIGYLQERQDYIATIASSYIPSFSPVNFKDSIYDELNPDLRFERHHGDDPNNYNRPQNILLSYIAKSEKLSRIESKESSSHDILLGYKSDEGTFGLDLDKNNSSNKALTPMRLINFALPGGTVGRQAIFSIVENIIRNVAKHNNIQGNLELTFETIDGEKLKASPEDYKNSISSNVIRQTYANSNDVPDLIILSITDNQKCSVDTINTIIGALEQPYIGEGEQTNKGIKEIRISATWIRGEEDDSLFAPCPKQDGDIIKNIKDLKAPAVAVERSDEGNLRYLIGLKKTYEFALVYLEEEKKELYKQKFDFKEGQYKLISIDSIIKSDTCFEYIVAENESVFQKIRPYVTNRCVNAEKIPMGISEKITSEMIYRYYAGFGKEFPYIVIADDRVDRIEYKEKIIKWKCPNDNACYMLYRSHHFNEHDFRSYWIDRANGALLGNNVLCIDGISGDNSSDRLVRREVLDERWYYRHLYALKSRVAVFDERLFQIVHGLDESQMTVGSFAVSDYINNWNKESWQLKALGDEEKEALAIDKFNIIDDGDIDEFVKIYKDCLEDTSKGIANNEGENQQKMKNFLGQFRYRFKDNVVGTHYLTAGYAEKGVDVFTIIPLGNNECIIVGNSDYEYKKDELDNPVYEFHFIPIARIQCDNGEFRIEKDKEYRFNYLSIHQGLIDKMYSEFNIMEDEEIGKKNLLIELYNCFMDEPVDKEKDSAFLPRMTIHSGRGHINKKDMPINQPFLQYSAIEHAVMDCKYSLIELLDYAKYKKS